MDFTKSIKQAIEIVKLNVNTIQKVAKDKDATTAGILILLIGGLIAGSTSGELLMLIISPLIILISSFIGVGVLYLLARLFGGKGGFIELYRVLTHGGIINWLSILYLIPLTQRVVSVITIVWGIVINFVVIKNLYKLTTFKTVLVIVIPVILFMIVLMVVAAAILVLNPGGLASLVTQ